MVSGLTGWMPCFALHAAVSVTDSPRIAVVYPKHLGLARSRDIDYLTVIISVSLTKERKTCAIHPDLHGLQSAPFIQSAPLHPASAI
jgi:hypothetical protein